MSSPRFSDDSLGTVVNTEGGGGGRATTPQMKRTTPRRQRQVTPQRTGSAPRSSSAGKVSALAKACFESQSCNRSLSRNAGRKKQQKWENDNLFGLSMFMRKVHALNKRSHDDSDSDEDIVEGSDHMRQGFALKWQSLFGTLTNGENVEALDAYLMCSNSYRVKKVGESKLIRDCVSEWDRAEFAWMKVEKRLRTVMLKALPRKESQQFVMAVEDLLLRLEQTELGKVSGPLSSQALQSVKHLFVKPPRFVRPSSQNSTHDDNVTDECTISTTSSQLVVTLIDSSFHRLLLHATCQFHNMHSKSFTDKKRDGLRATRIVPFQSKKCHHTISLVPFVLLKLSDEEAPTTTGKENTPANSHLATSDSAQKLDQDDAISLDELKLEVKSSEQEDIPPPSNEISKSPRGEENSDNDESDDDDEYCLVNIVSSSSATTNPLEIRENL